MRIFIAIDIPASLKEKVFDFVCELKKRSEKGIKFVEKENLHLTLKFLGEVEKNNLDLVVEKLNGVSFHPFKLNLKDVGCFPDFFNPRVFWIGITDEKKDFFSLYKNIVSFLPEGLFEEEEETTPHLTIARFKSKPSKEFIDFIKSKKGIDFGEFVVKSFCIYESKLTPYGPVYKKVIEFFSK